jgi:hypothetical protein
LYYFQDTSRGPQLCSRKATKGACKKLSLRPPDAVYTRPMFVGRHYTPPPPSETEDDGKAKPKPKPKLVAKEPPPKAKAPPPKPAPRGKKSKPARPPPPDAASLPDYGPVSPSAGTKKSKQGAAGAVLLPAALPTPQAALRRGNSRGPAATELQEPSPVRAAPTAGANAQAPSEPSPVADAANANGGTGSAGDGAGAPRLERAQSDHAEPPVPPVPAGPRRSWSLKEVSKARFTALQSQVKSFSERDSVKKIHQKSKAAASLTAAKAQAMGKGERPSVHKVPVRAGPKCKMMPSQH